MKKSIRRLILGCIVFLVTGCYFPGGPIPEDPVAPALKEPIEPKVVVQEEFIYSPYPRTNGAVPEEFICSWDCDYIRFLRYRPETLDMNPKPVEAVIVLMPGYMGGANSFEYLGRQIVSMAEADDSTGSVEVWAIDRRGNCLEDLTGMNAAEEVSNPQIAADYYFNGLEIDGKTFQGYHTDEDLQFLSEFGLELLMEDIRTIITTKIPDADARKNCVFIGGHSMGGSFTSYFAGWDFDGDPETIEDAGYTNCAGLIGLDGFVGPRTSSMDKETYFDTLTKIRSGEEPRLNLFTGVTPEAMALLELMALNAFLFPDDEATLIREIPYSKETENLIKLLHSRDLSHFITGSPSISDFRYTNEALLGVFLDDNFQVVSFLQASLGFLAGGAVVEKNFPGDLADLLGMGSTIKSDGVFIPWDAGPFNELGSGPLYSWVNFDEVGNASDPDYTDTKGELTYTSWTQEVTDIHDFALSLYQGPSNFMEWYFTSRISLDSSAAAADFNADYGLNFLHGDILENFPIVNFSVRSDPQLAGYNHHDVLFAAVDRPSHRPNEVFGRLLEFVFDNTDGTTVVVP